MIPYYDVTNNERLGRDTKAEIHRLGLPHRTSLLMFVAVEGVLVTVRSANQSFAGCLDLIGGHEDSADDNPVGTVRETAVREAKEEVDIRFSGVRWTPGATDLQILGGEGVMRVDSPNNVERSSLYGVDLRTVELKGERTIRVGDEDDAGRYVEREWAFMTLAELESRFENDPGFAADGLRRVLAKMANDPEFRTSVLDFVGAEAV